VGGAEGKADSPLSREPDDDMEFEPRTLRSGPEPKADA